MNIKDSKHYLSPHEVARIFMVSPITVRSWAEKGWLSAETTAGGHRRYLQEEVQRFAETRGLRVTYEARTALRVLVVEDDRQLSAYLEELLLNVSPQVKTRVAHFGFEAGLQVQDFKPDVVLLDLMMPGMDGFQVCERIKADPETRAIRVIAMTGYPAPESIARISAAGAECCLNKPINVNALFDLLGVQHAESAQ